MMTEDLTPEEIQTLSRFDQRDPPEHLDPQAFAKLLSLALIEQKEGGPELTEKGHLVLKEKRNSEQELDAELDAELEQTFPASDPPNVTRFT